MAVVYSVTNQKGGVGKTTTCLCLGSALAEQGYRILLVDFDPQAGLTVSLGNEPESFSKTIYDSLIDCEQNPLKDVIVDTKVKNLFLAPSNLDLAGAEGELIGEIGWDRNLKDALGEIKNNFDFVFIDCPPSLGVLTTNALICADTAIIPVQTEYLALRGLKQLSDIIVKVRKKGNPELRKRILRTMHNTRTLHSREVVEELEKIFPDEVFKTIIKRTVKFADATLAGMPIIQYASTSEASEAYRNLAREVIEDAAKTISKR
ncbi:MAG: ParA family protein [Candidatus Omnitrophica bacterium]|nr:ParA family protein [Candidatus Omnitrophota bacterium]